MTFIEQSNILSIVTLTFHIRYGVLIPEDRQDYNHYQHIKFSVHSTRLFLKLFFFTIQLKTSLKSIITQ